MEKKKGGRYRNQSQFEMCALAVAAGSSVGRWARENKVHERTAYGWSMKPEFKALVSGHRDRIINRSVGILVKHSTAASRELARLIKNGTNDSIKLAASRAILDQMIAVSNHAESSKVLAEMQARLTQIESSLPQAPK
jgi:hypothetical protein